MLCIPFLSGMRETIDVSQRVNFKCLKADKCIFETWRRRFQQMVPYIYVPCDGFPPHLYPGNENTILLLWEYLSHWETTSRLFCTQGVVTSTILNSCQKSLPSQTPRRFLGSIQNRRSSCMFCEFCPGGPLRMVSATIIFCQRQPNFMFSWLTVWLELLVLDKELVNHANGVELKSVSAFALRIGYPYWKGLHFLF